MVASRAGDPGSHQDKAGRGSAHVSPAVAPKGPACSTQAVTSAACGGGGVDGDGRMTSPKPPRLGRNVPADASGPVPSVGGPEPGVRVPREPPKHADSWAPGSSSGSWRPRTPQVRRVFLHPPGQLQPRPPACSLVPSPPAGLGPANAPVGGGAPHPTGVRECSAQMEAASVPAWPRALDEGPEPGTRAAGSNVRRGDQPGAPRGTSLVHEKE